MRKGCKFVLPPPDSCLAFVSDFEQICFVSLVDDRAHTRRSKRPGGVYKRLAGDTLMHEKSIRVEPTKTRDVVSWTSKGITLNVLVRI